MWNFTGKWHLWFGQTKLPGNRERIISSGSLQFVDRSRMNSRFNIDRDTGIQLRNTTAIGRGVIKQAYSISMGEGQNITENNTGGYDYTVRFDYLPFGTFTSKGDYFGSDLKREPKPKLSIGVVYDFNDGATRQRGQNGDFMFDSLGNRLENNLNSIFVDAMFKHRGFSIMSEYVNKSASDNLLGFNTEGNVVKYATGDGFVFQSGYLLKNNWEISGRYSFINPDNIQYSSIVEEDVYTIGISKFFKNHNLKLQVNSSYRDITGRDDQIRVRVQVEMQL